MSLHVRDCVIVVPCFDEAGRLHGDPFLDFVARRPGSALLFVDDGSRDATVEAIEAIIKRAPGRIAILRLQRNGGKGEAVRRGLLRALEAGPRYVGFWDADLATPLDEVDRLERHLDAHPGVQLAIGSRVRMLGCAVRRSPVRRHLGCAASVAISRLLGADVHDSQCGAKLLRAGAHTREMLAVPFATRWLFDVELIARHAALGALSECVHEIPVRQWEGVPGSRLGGRELVRIPLELLRIARLQRRAPDPASRAGQAGSGTLG